MKNRNLSTEQVKHRIPFDLQFFADEDPEVAEGQEGIEDDGAEHVPSINELMTQLAQERAEKEKNKTALDKALREKGEITKQLRARMTAQEQEDAAKAEQSKQHEEYVKNLERRVALTDAKARYLKLGFSAELSEKAAAAELDGDMDTVAESYKQHEEAVIKAAQADWLKDRPDVQAGNGEGEDKEDPFLKGFNQK